MDRSLPDKSARPGTAALDALNAAPRPDAVDTFRRCCGATAWCEAMADARPFPSTQAIRDAAPHAFATLDQAAWLEAFAAHPKIGDLSSLRMKYRGNREWSASEQAGVGDDTASEDVLVRLAEGNAAYESRFGFIFIVCATGKPATEMLAILESRLPNTRDRELRIAAAEQARITALRIDKLLT